MIWESRRLAEAVVDLRLPQREEDDLVQALRGIETSGLTLRRHGVRHIAVDVGNPLNLFDLASKVGAVRERHIETARPAPGSH